MQNDEKGILEIIHELQVLPPKPKIPRMVKVLAWNCRETKVSQSQAGEICRSLRFSNWKCADPIGCAGWVWLLWNSSEIKLDIIQFDSHVVNAVAEVSCTPNPWILYAIYAPNPEDRSLFWNTLVSFSSTFNLPWLLVGNFNDMLSSSDKSGGLPVRPARLQAFNNFINSCNLVDLGYYGPKFTWVRKIPTSNIIMERLDWAFASQF
ncbi:hypothetical protein LIER_31587 [Lithospermum erythrorhizon]|uniref:Endonuclease/exonuclease/phosphatase domain-containing protein n=1 Tax=Lithospermum erythrorhizon TaxID=34254 RepID=A0AAV3RS51_LITER